MRPGIGERRRISAIRPAIDTFNCIKDNTTWLERQYGWYLVRRDLVLCTALPMRMAEIGLEANVAGSHRLHSCKRLNDH